MKTIYTFNQMLMNGTVTMQTQVNCFGSRELAEKVSEAVKMANIDAFDNPEFHGMYCRCSEIEETVVYENEEEVPILNRPI